MNVDESLVFGDPKNEGNVSAEAVEHGTLRNDENPGSQWPLLPTGKG